jgi:hypothetical protein
MLKKELPAPQRTGLAWWDALSKDEKYDVLVKYFEASGTDIQIAYLLQIRKTSVKRIRDIYDRKVHPEWYRHGKRIKRIKKKKPVLHKVINISDRKPYKRPRVRVS